VKIDLLSEGKPIGPTGVDDLARSAVVWVIANIFDKQVRVASTSRSTTNVASEIALLF
jgi:hypothetical protein